eukprot:12612502-Ditylum_brightwellii.AAC.1
MERLAQAVLKSNVDFCCLQETWLSGDYRCQIEMSHLGTPSNCLFFHHGQPVQEGRGSGGVGILLGSGSRTAWKQAVRNQLEES